MINCEACSALLFDDEIPMHWERHGLDFRVEDARTTYLTSDGEVLTTRLSENGNNEFSEYLDPLDADLIDA